MCCLWAGTQEMPRASSVLDSGTVRRTHRQGLWCGSLRVVSAELRGPGSVGPHLAREEEPATWTPSNRRAPPAGCPVSHQASQAWLVILTCDVEPAVYTFSFSLVPVLMLSVGMVHLSFLLKALNFPKGILSMRLFMFLRGQHAHSSFELIHCFIFFPHHNSNK